MRGEGRNVCVWKQRRMCDEKEGWMTMCVCGVQAVMIDYFGVALFCSRRSLLPSSVVLIRSPSDCGPAPNELYA